MSFFNIRKIQIVNYGCNCGLLKKVVVSKEENFVIKRKACNVKFKNLPSCKAISPYKISDQYEIYSENKRKETLRVNLDKWM